MSLVSLSLRLKDLLGPVTRVKKKKKVEEVRGGGARGTARGWSRCCERFRVEEVGGERTVRTGSWTGPPRGKRAPRVGMSSAVFGG